VRVEVELIAEATADTPVVLWSLGDGDLDIERADRQVLRDALEQQTDQAGGPM
jgi:hypothetical protein